MNDTTISHQPKVFIIILNWNNLQDTVECLESVKKLNYQNFEIVLVDNASTDGSVQVLEEEYPEVILLKNERNLGYAVGNNEGIEKAMELGCEYIFLLNNDTIVDGDCLKELVKTAESDLHIGIVGPKIYLFQDPSIVWYAGGEILFRDAISHTRGLFKRDHPSYNTIKEVSFITGCAMLVKKEAIEGVGLFDHHFVSYMEDTDLCWRMKKKGFKLVYLPDAKIYHKVSQSFGTTAYNEKTMYLMGRNAVLFVKKYGNFTQWLKFITFFWLSIIYAFPREAMKRNHKAVFAKIRGFFDGIIEKGGNSEVR
ncbi:MAG: glycosyltransferase family 2 protein [Deltaproteobacteria bacterium]|nr:glycosyltransferase family 2 protein [Deltaproteobacteria bacterium]